MEPRFAIGTTFIPTGKKYLCTIVDILKTYNSKNELVRVEYLTQHDFCGQKVTDRVGDTTIARGILSNGN